MQSDWPMLGSGVIIWWGVGTPISKEWTIGHRSSMAPSSGIVLEAQREVGVQAVQTLPEAHARAVEERVCTDCRKAAARKRGQQEAKRRRQQYPQSDRESNEKGSCVELVTHWMAPLVGSIAMGCQCLVPGSEFCSFPEAFVR